MSLNQYGGYVADAMVSNVPNAGDLYVNDTNAHTGGWQEIKALENTVVSALTSSTLTGFASGMKIAAGESIKGVFSAITLTSGSVILRSNRS